MNKNVGYVLLLALGAVVLTAGQFHVRGAGIEPVQLRCAYAANPLGVDSPNPRLFWKLEGDQRGQKQTAYQILTASTEASLKKNAGDLWDSGKVISDDTIQIAYAGRPLTSLQQVFWKVRVWDANGKVSKWSPVATWTTGILDESDWSAHWISADGAEKYAVFYPSAARRDFGNRQAFARVNPDAGKITDPDYSSMLARREFRVKAGLVHAVVDVCGLGQYQLSMNGKKVGDNILSPGWTEYRKTILYVIVGDLAEVKASYDSIHRAIVSAWKRDDDKLTLDVTVPPNTTATIFVPTADVQSVTESGQPVALCKQARFMRMEKDAAVFEIGSGHYQFACLLL